MHARAWCEIDGEGWLANVRRLREVAGVPLVLMVKADAYGLGVEALLRGVAELTEPDTPWALGVATVAEGEALRSVGWTGRVLCCSPVLAQEHAAMRTARITPSLHRAADIVAWCDAGDAPWHLAVDTGMSRAGIDWREVGALRAVVAAHAPEGVFTHFHSALAQDGSRVAQEARFRDALQLLALPPDTLRHAENSHALTARAERAPVAAAWDLARPGLALYGSPSASALGLRAVLHVYARVIDVREVAAGDTVGYDATWTANRPSRIATVGIGYGDGYRRALSNAGEMLLHGHRVPVAGLISMDMTMLDVTDVPCEVGDVVTVLGRPAGDDNAPTLSLDEVASRGGLSPYELLVGWRLRLPRVYRQRT
jgi:alanine racemase